MSELGFYIRKGWPLPLMAILAAAAFYINHSLMTDYKDRIAIAEKELSSMKTAIDLSRKRAEDYNRIKSEMND